MSYTKEEKDFFAFLRSEYFKENDFKKKIKESYERENQILTKEHILNNTSEIIFYLVNNSTKLWNEIIKNIESDWVKLYLTKTIDDQKKFPKIYNLFETLIKENIDTTDPKQNVINIANRLGLLFSNLVYSNKQSAKSRAGSLLEHHISTLLDLCKYKYAAQESFIDGEVLDFVFPATEYAKENPELSISAECQNTLKDRSRLTQGKLQHINIQRHLFTASGLNAATDTDHNDLTPRKIQELKRVGITLVVFKKIKEDKFSSEQAVISYEDFFNISYPKASEKWD